MNYAYPNKEQNTVILDFNMTVFAMTIEQATKLKDELTLAIAELSK